MDPLAIVIVIPKVDMEASQFKRLRLKLRILIWSKNVDRVLVARTSKISLVLGFVILCIVEV